VNSNVLLLFMTLAMYKWRHCRQHLTAANFVGVHFHLVPLCSGFGVRKGIVLVACCHTTARKYNNYYMIVTQVSLC